MAIYSPNLGAVSETFIKKHMEELAIDQTVVVAGSNELPYCGHWFINCPTYILSNKNSIFLNTRTKLWLTILHLFGLRSRKNLYYHQELEEFLIQNNVKVILSEYLHYSTTIIDLAKKLGIKLYAHAHGNDVSATLKRKFWRREYLRLNKADGIITVSEYSKQKLIKLGLKKELIHVIPCGIKLPPSFSSTNESECIKCLAVGRMVSKKAPLLLLESFRLAAEKNDFLRLDFIGDGVLYKNALQYVKDHNLEDKVKLHGSLAHGTVMNMMKDANIFLQHSITDPVTGDQEGLPVSILEGMAHYLPVISTSHAGIPEAVINNKSGILVNEADTPAMAEAILKLAENKNLRRDMGRAGREIIEEKFTWEIEKRSLLNLIDKENSLIREPSYAYSYT